MPELLSNVAFRKIMNFAELARVGHFGRASTRLGISQPALSRSIQNLEKDLGVALVNRHSKGVVLTLEGNTLLSICGTIEKSIERMATIGAKAGGRSSATIGIPPTLSSLLIGSLFERVSLLWPGDAFRFQEASSAAIERDVLSGDLDFGLVYDPVETSEFNAVPLVGESLAFVCSPKWDIAASGDTLRLRDVLHLPVILPSPGQHERRVILKAETKGGFRLDPILEIDTPSTIRSLVHDGLGYTLATPQSVSDEVKRGSLVCRPLGMLALATRLHVIRPRYGAQAEKAREIALTIREIAASLIRTQRWAGGVLLDLPPVLVPDETMCAVELFPTETDRKKSRFPCSDEPLYPTADHDRSDDALAAD